MNAIHVSASANYDVLIGSGLLNRIGPLLKGVSKAQTLAVISDDNVWPLYGEGLLEKLQAEGFAQIHTFVFDPGEESKNGSTYLAILEFLAQNHLTRSDCLIALGGGVVGDMTGFVAATYLRGIDYIQVPTTLLAAVDSSVGGKTAIDLAAGKNLAGAFYQPKLVVCDTDTLDSLPEAIFRDGCAEVIKYAVLYDTELFTHLQTYGTGFDREWVIGRCVELKRNVVAADVFDRGLRQKLNLGHTLGHGIEAESHYAVSHGQAVAIGMAMVSRAAAKRGFCDAAVAKDIVTLLAQFGLPITTGYSPETIYHTALLDKKRSGNFVNLIVPKTIGNCEIHSMDVKEMLSFIEDGI